MQRALYLQLYTGRFKNNGLSVNNCVSWDHWEADIQIEWSSSGVLEGIIPEKGAGRKQHWAGIVSALNAHLPKTFPVRGLEQRLSITGFLRWFLCSNVC